MSSCKTATYGSPENEINITNMYCLKFTALPYFYIVVVTITCFLLISLLHTTIFTCDASIHVFAVYAEAFFYRRSNSIPNEIQQVVSSRRLFLIRITNELVQWLLGYLLALLTVCGSILYHHVMMKSKYEDRQAQAQQKSKPELAELRTTTPNCFHFIPFYSLFISIQYCSEQTNQ